MARPRDGATLRAGRGALRFARYALAPNRLGYCGPGDVGALFEQAVALGASASIGAGGPSAAPDSPGGRFDLDDLTEGLRSLARGFEGAWPYLELIAGANGLADPLDDSVVSAYWLGGPRLERVGAHAAGNHVEDRFRRRAGRWWAEVSAALEPGVAPGHAFHVLVVGPWVGMLRSGHTGAPLAVMDRCRIRRARVLEVHGDEAVVRTDRLVLRDGVLGIDEAAPEGVVERVRLGEAGNHPCGPVRAGDLVTLHWDWVCEAIDDRIAARVGLAESAALQRANRALAHAGPVELGG